MNLAMRIALMPLNLAASGSKYTPPWQGPRQGRRLRDERDGGSDVEDAPAAWRQKWNVQMHIKLYQCLFHRAWCLQTNQCQLAALNIHVIL